MWRRRDRTCREMNRLLTPRFRCNIIYSGDGRTYGPRTEFGKNFVKKVSPSVTKKKTHIHTAVVTLFRYLVSR